MRSGSVLRSAHGACVSTYWLQANTARSHASMPDEKAKRSNASGTSSVVAACDHGEQLDVVGVASPGAGRTPSKFLKIIDNVRCARLPKLFASSALARLTIASAL